MYAYLQFARTIVKIPVGDNVLRNPANYYNEPRNDRNVSCTQRTIQAVAEAAKKQLENAATVNGLDCLIYRTKSYGRPCSCTRHRKQVTDVLQADGTMTDANLQRLLSGGDIEEFDYREGAKSSSNPVVETDNLPPGGDSSVSDETIDPPTQQEAGGLTAFVNGYNVGNRCGICFGTGKVGGYNLTGSFREVIDVTFPSTTKVVEVLDTMTPVRMVAHADSWLEFEIKLPKNAKQLESLRLFNNDKTVLKGWKLQALRPISTPTWVDVVTLMDWTTGKPQKFRILFDADTKFTHLEIQLQLYRTLVPIDFSRISDSYNLQYLQFLGSVRLVAPPSVTSLPVNSVIVDCQFGRYWKCVDVQDHQDKFRNVYQWEINSRLIHPQEIDSLLPFTRELIGLNRGSTFKKPLYQRRDTGIL